MQWQPRRTQIGGERGAVVRRQYRPAGPILFDAIDILLLGHSGREKRCRPCQGGDIMRPIVDSLAVPDLGKHGAVACCR